MCSPLVRNLIENWKIIFAKFYRILMFVRGLFLEIFYTILRTTWTLYKYNALLTQQVLR